ncbi:hypothetical protein GOP47_0029750 [Adiantum capillus-veneris]|nr:hypothetical protein GOP47_0029750 [Adiantum capillus-veneris]
MANEEEAIQGKACEACLLMQVEQRVLSFKIEDPLEEGNGMHTIKSFRIGNRIYQSVQGWVADRAIACRLLQRFKSTPDQLTVVWDDGILCGLKSQHYSQSSILELIKDIQENITGYWKDDVPNWTSCEAGKVTCPDLYAKESIKLACWWAYKGASRGSNLDDRYYHSRLAVVQKRLAQAGVRLASILNKVLL